MRSGSNTALGHTRIKWEAVLEKKAPSEVALAQDLFLLSDTVRASLSLLSAFTQVSRSVEDRVNLARTIFGEKVNESVLNIFLHSLEYKWSEPEDLITAIETLATDALLHAAQRENLLDRVEAELYQSVCLLEQNRDLSFALNDNKYDLSAKTNLVQTVFSMLNPYAQELLLRAVTLYKYASISNTLGTFMNAVAERDKHLIATATSSIALTSAQEQRLTAILAKYYGQKVMLHVNVDSSVLGGMRICVGDEVIDGSLITRLKVAKKVFNK